MQYKINYRTDYDENGTHYNQNVVCDIDIIDILNDDIDTTLILNKDTYNRDHLSRIKRIDNKAFLTITQLQRLKSKIPFKQDKRLKTDRNTILIIKN